MFKKKVTIQSFNLSRLHGEIEAAVPGVLAHLDSIDNDVYICTSTALDAQQEQLVDDIVAAHISQTTTEFAHTKVDQAILFGSALMADFAAENVAMGITQAGKSGDVLAVMEDKVNVSTSTRPVSAMSAIQSGTLYTACDVIDYHISNISNYSDLSPFITVDRLTSIKQKILNFLGS